MSRSRYIAQAGLIAAVYAALTVGINYLPFALGWGLVQFRLSEAFTVVAMFTPAGIPGLTLGCVIANALNPYAVWPISLLDVGLGSFATALGAIWMWRFRSKKWLALAGPVVANALIVPAYLPFILAGLGMYEVPFLGIDFEGAWLTAYLFGVAAIGISEAFVVYVGGGLALSLFRRAGVTDVES